MGDTIRNRVKFVTEPINPELDIHPTNECKIEVREIDIWDGKAKQPAKSKMACVYRGDGCVGTITEDRLITLRQLYDVASQAGYHAMMIPPPRSFEAEMVDLIARYRPKNKSQTEWRLSPHTCDALKTHFSTTTERFATPLTVTNASTHYWSDQERDQIFGARTKRYNHQWTGFSQALLPSDSPSIDKAIHWALWPRHTHNQTHHHYLIHP
jgi:hypothetical protein